MRELNKKGAARTLQHHATVVLGSGALSMAFFLVLPLMQAIHPRNANDSLVRSVDTVQIPPPPAPPEPEPEKEKDPDEKPPEMSQEMPQLDFSQLEVALNPSMTGGWMGGGFNLEIQGLGKGDSSDGLFSLADLDQKPRATYQPNPILTTQARQKLPGHVVVLFLVDEQGRVVQPKVHESSDPAFVEPALSALRQWRFEPGKRKGKPVRFRMRLPMTFPKGS